MHRDVAYVPVMAVPLIAPDGDRLASDLAAQSVTGRTPIGLASFGCVRCGETHNHHAMFRCLYFDGVPVMVFDCLPCDFERRVGAWFGESRLP